MAVAVGALMSTGASGNAGVASFITHSTRCVFLCVLIHRRGFVSATMTPLAPCVARGSCILCRFPSASLFASPTFHVVACSLRAWIDSLYPKAVVVRKPTCRNMRVNGRKTRTAICPRYIRQDARLGTIYEGCLRIYQTSAGSMSDPLPSVEPSANLSPYIPPPRLLRLPKDPQQRGVQQW